MYPTTILAGLMLDDIDKDGIEDVVGAFENATPAHERWLGVLSGADGHEIWARRAKDVIGDAMLEQSLRAVVLGRLIVVDPSGRVQTLQEWDGALDWNRTLAAPARDLCAGAHHLLFLLADGSQVPLAVATGVRFRRRPMAHASRSPVPARTGRTSAWPWALKP